MPASTFSTIPLFARLPSAHKEFLEALAARYPFTFQQLKMLTEYSADLHCWKMGGLQRFHRPEAVDGMVPKRAASQLFELFRRGYEEVRAGEKRYTEESGESCGERKFPRERMAPVQLRGKIMGQCPVASEKTRCCNLKTLDAVQQCGFDCSYCSIQSFYHGDQVRFVENLEAHLEALELEGDRLYHIGTGQSSDSLMWGNRFGLLDALCRFAVAHPNVILEMKSKSGRIDYFLENRPPANMVFTWSLNTPKVIRHEEKGAAPLDVRLASARKLADRGCPVGFHFHPIIWYQGWREEYLELVATLTDMFRPEEVVMVSLGTLTFTRAVVRRIRNRLLNSSILQMPLEDCAGKLSYPLQIKEEMFGAVYRGFPEAWRDDPFFYMCMEHEALWEPVFGRSYPSNEDFEQAMLTTYHARISRIGQARQVSPVSASTAPCFPSPGSQR